MTAVQENDSQELTVPLARPVEKLLVVVMGVSGCGKSTLGSHIASALSLPFIDADGLHPQSNVDKMSRGEPLTDEDRAPWLERVRNAAAVAAHTANVTRTDGDSTTEHPPNHPAPVPSTPEGIAHSDSSQSAGGTVVACSALKRAYRDVLRDGPLRTVFVHPHGAYDVLLSRMHARKDHFMKASMLNSQIATLEDPADEVDVIKVPVELGMREQVDITLKGLEDLNLVRK